MKNFALVLAFSFVTLGCTKDNNKIEKNIPTELIGKWKVIEIYSTDGGSEPEWIEIADGFSYTFSNNYIVIRDNLQTGCNEGKFSIINENTIKFVFPCISYNSYIENNTDTLLILDTKNFEPLKYKFQKVTE